jgi:hypothetical protein
MEGKLVGLFQPLWISVVTFSKKKKQNHLITGKTSLESRFPFQANQIKHSKCYVPGLPK